MIISLHKSIAALLFGPVVFIVHTLVQTSTLTWNDPLAQFVVFRLSVEQPPTSTVDLLAVVLEVHVVVEAGMPEADVAKFVFRLGPRLKPVRTAERYRQSGQRKHAPAETDPSKSPGRRRLFIGYLTVRHFFFTFASC